MASRLAAAGLLSGVYNRTRANTDAFSAATGMAGFASPAELAAASNVVILMVADEVASRDLTLAEGGLLEGLSPGSVVIEMSTVSADHIREMASILGRAGCDVLDAPVSGSVPLARDGSLSILVGGDIEVLERVRPALEALGSNLFYLGGLGAGSAMKLAVNTVVYALNQGISEGLVLAERAGIERDAAYEVFANSAVAAPFVHYRRAQFENPGDLEPSLSLHLAAKDLRLILRLAASVDLKLPQAETGLDVLDEAVGAGLAEADVSAVAELLRRGGNDQAAE